MIATCTEKAEAEETPQVSARLRGVVAPAEGSTVAANAALYSADEKVRH